MADSAFGLERSIDPTTYSPVTSVDRGNGDRDRASVSASPLGAPDATLADIESLVRLGTRKQENGRDAEAEEHFREALALGERAFGPDRPELMLLLTDLSRLYLKKSSFASAEPLLLRLLDMKRSKGEDHPEVATVLASLATVRQALGRHESAEQLWRRVLEIRENTLAPNHFAIATTLEHLGGACAARGKISEALRAFQRAASIRELTLGAEHPSLRVSRERIADLQLQAEDSLDPGITSDAPITPQRYRLSSGEPQTLTVSTNPNRERIQAPPSPRKASVFIRSGLADVRVAETPPPALLSIPEPPPEPPQGSLDVTESMLAAIGSANPPVPEPVPYHDALQSVMEELEQPYEESISISERAAEILSTVLTVVGKKQVVGGLVVVVLALLVVGVVTDSHAFGESQTATLSPAAIGTIRNPALVVPASVASNTSDASSSPTTGGTSAPKSAPARTRPVEDRPATTKKASEKEKKPESKIAIPTVSTSMMSRLDEVASNTSASAHAGDIQLSTPAIVSTRHSFDDSEAPSAPQRARLIGDLPTPRVPDQVADVVGEVSVRFNVDADGRPMMSTFSVVNSPNPLLTNAVRKVIPELRFEPARTGGANSRAIVDAVQIGFQFSRR